MINKKSEDEQKDVIYYSKNKKISFNVIKLYLENIPILKSVKLSFYEKYIILILQKGIYAKDIDNLINKISNILNFSEKCIRELIEFLDEKKFIKFKSMDSIYTLDESLHFYIDPKYDNAMFAEFDDKLADCNDIIYLDNINKFFLENDFDSKVYSKKGSTDLKSKTKLTEIIQRIEGDIRKIQPYVERSFEKTNKHLINNFSFDLKKELIKEYSFEFEVGIVYKYNKKTNESKLYDYGKLQQVVDHLGEKYYDELLKQYMNDSVLPKFISLDKELYQAIPEQLDNVTTLNKQILNNNEENHRAKVIVENSKKEINELKKKYKKDEKELKSEIEFLNSEKQKNLNVIDIKLNLISNKDVDSKLEKNINDSIIQLKKDNKDLEIKLNEKLKDLDVLNKEYSVKKDELEKDKISSENKIEISTKESKKYKSELKTSQQKILSLKEKLDSGFQIAIERYEDKNVPLFFDYVVRICTELDKAINCSEHKSFDELVVSVKTLRSLSDSLLLVILNVVFSKKAEKLVSYFGKGSDIIELESKLNPRDVKNIVISNTIKYHQLSNAIGHKEEKGKKESDNKEMINNFKELSSYDRRLILSAIPNLLSTISLTGEELREINDMLKA